MIEWIIVGLLAGILFALLEIGKELARFRMRFDEIGLSDYDQKNLIDTIGRTHDTLREISIHTSP